MRNPETLSAISSLLSTFGYGDPVLQRYVEGGGIDFSQREGNVHSWHVAGEILTPLRAIGATIVGQDQVTPIDVGSPSLLDSMNPLALISGAVDLHSISLLHALLVSPAFREAVRLQPYALETFFDGSLYARDPETSDTPDFLVRLLLQHIGDGTADVPRQQRIGYAGSRSRAHPVDRNHRCRAGHPSVARRDDRALPLRQDTESIS